jgi:tetratricopeptide (TPR) repeat protein
MWCLLSPLLAIIFSLAAATCVYSQRDRDTYNPGNQTFEVSGQVNISGPNVPARNVPVRLERFSGGTVDQMNTDDRGRFRFANLQRGYYKVVINAPGFSPAQQEADLTLLFKTYLLFRLTKTDSDSGVAFISEVIDARVPAAARDEFARGREALARRNLPDAITHLDKAISLYSQFFEAELLLATAFMDLREWTRAETALGRALEIRPEHPIALLSLGEVYWRQKRYEEAEHTLLDGLKLDEKNWHGHFTLGRLYWEKGDIMKAAPAIGRTLQLKPDFAEAHLVAGNILLRLDQQQRALVEYQEYLRLAPKGEYASEARNLIEKLSKPGRP